MKLFWLIAFLLLYFLFLKKVYRTSLGDVFEKSEKQYEHCMFESRNVTSSDLQLNSSTGSIALISDQHLTWSLVPFIYMFISFGSCAELWLSDTVPKHQYWRNSAFWYSAQCFVLWTKHYLVLLFYFFNANRNRMLNQKILFLRIILNFKWPCSQRLHYFTGSPKGSVGIFSVNLNVFFFVSRCLWLFQL